MSLIDFKRKRRHCHIEDQIAWQKSRIFKVMTKEIHSVEVARKKNNFVNKHNRHRKGF